jgi:hypothetical protein
MAPRINRINQSVKQRIVYQDFKMNLDLNPITGQIALNTNQEAVIQAIKNLVLIYPTEIYYHPNIGSLVSRSLFEFTDDFSMQQLKDSILQTIQNYEPRAQNVLVIVTPNPQQNQINVDIQFNLVNVAEVFSVPTIVVRVR